MKKIFNVVLAMVLVLTITITTMTGCGSVKNSHLQSSSNEDAKYQIVCTIFPIYDWVVNIIGDNDNVNVTLLLDQGTDLHSFQPTAADIALVSSADMFIYVGGESDAWVEDAIGEAKNTNMKAISLMDVLSDSVVTEEVKEGMQESNSESEEEEEYDEHVWLSLKNAETIVEYLGYEISDMDSDNKTTYQENAESYEIQLRELDEQYQEMVDTASLNTLIFADRFPFRYLVEDYGLDYYAAFSGCSAETEASFETIIFLAGKVDEIGTNIVLTIENSDTSIADTVIENTTNKTATTAVLNSMQSVTSGEVRTGTTYIGIMQNNLVVLKDALN